MNVFEFKKSKLLVKEKIMSDQASKNVQSKDNGKSKKFHFTKQQAFWIVIIGMIILVILFLIYAIPLFIKNNQELSLTASEDLAQSLIQGNDLPWIWNQDRVRAVINCSKQKPIKVRTMRSFGTEIHGCIYHLAVGTSIQIGERSLSREGRVFFTIPKD